MRDKSRARKNNSLKFRQDPDVQGESVDVNSKFSLIPELFGPVFTNEKISLRQVKISDDITLMDIRVNRSFNNVDTANLSDWQKNENDGDLRAGWNNLCSRLDEEEFSGVYRGNVPRRCVWLVSMKKL